MSAEAETKELKVIGRGPNRVDGRAKVTGRANYAADNSAPGLVHAVGVFSTVAAGRIAALDAAAAEKAPGVLAVLHAGNVGKLYRSPNEMDNDTRVGEVRPPFEDDKIYYAGQFVALVVAETFEQARAAALGVNVSYDQAAEMTVELNADERLRGARVFEDAKDYERGNAEEAFARAGTKVDVTYTTPVEVHNPMELHASVAVWTGEKLDVHESTQWVVGQRKALAKVLGVPPENVTVHAPYIGGGFGGKLFLWPHTVLAAVAARKVGRPVKLVVDRRREFTTVGHRPSTRQRLRIAAGADGKLAALTHESVSETSLVHDFLESSGHTSRSLYGCANVRVTHRLVSGNVGTPTSMRAPGAASGMIALEGAMDELAVALGVDPIEFRLRTAAESDGDKKKPWSSNHVRECCEVVRDKFGWAKRSAAPGSMRDGDEVLGWGFALACWSAEREEAMARVELRADGTARALCATQDIGTGTYTVIAQTVAEITGLPLEKIEVAIGNSDFPRGPISGGSMATASVTPAVIDATKKAIAQLLKVATKKGGPLAGVDAKELSFHEGMIVVKGGRRVSIADALAAENMASVDGEAHAQPGEEREKFSFKSYGAHAVEVRWDPGIARLRVARIVSAFDVGQVINAKTAANQVYGSLVMGIGMALLERAVYDERSGLVVTDNLADYLVPVHADTPEMDVTFLAHPDVQMGGFGARGVGEIGITGVGGAIVNAVYHATGKRVRDLPITLEKLLV